MNAKKSTILTLSFRSDSSEFIHEFAALIPRREQLTLKYRKRQGARIATVRGDKAAILRSLLKHGKITYATVTDVALGGLYWTFYAEDESGGTDVFSVTLDGDALFTREIAELIGTAAKNPNFAVATRGCVDDIGPKFGGYGVLLTVTKEMWFSEWLFNAIFRHSPLEDPAVVNYEILNFSGLHHVILCGDGDRCTADLRAAFSTRLDLQNKIHAFRSADPIYELDKDGPFPNGGSKMFKTWLDEKRKPTQRSRAKYLWIGEVDSNWQYLHQEVQAIENLHINPN